MIDICPIYKLKNLWLKHQVSNNKVYTTMFDSKFINSLRKLCTKFQISECLVAKDLLTSVPLQTNIQHLFVPWYRVRM